MKPASVTNKLVPPLWLLVLFCAVCSARAQAGDPCTRGADHDLGPNFDQIAPAATVVDSRVRLEARERQLLRWFANRDLPANDPSDDREYDPAHPNNPRLNSRSDVRALSDRATARILLGCDATDAEEILLDSRTKPFSLPGTSTRSDASCYRDGDYDFALIDLLRLAYVAQAHPGSLSEETQRAMLDKLLTLRGPIRETSYELQCKGIWLAIEDTENHILMTQIARYLTNQLLAQAPEHAGDATVDNARNGNNVWMLEHLAMFMREHFYEYNARPYQGYTVAALNALHSFAADREVALAAEMVLDVVSAFSALQNNELRRFPPFRRQPAYAPKSQSWVGDGEFERLALLVGNYHTLDNPGRGAAPNYALPRDAASAGEYWHVGLTAAASRYRMDDVLMDLAIREDSASQFFVGNHYSVEMYASSPAALISAGGHATVGEIPKIGLAPRSQPFGHDILGGSAVQRVIDRLGKVITNAAGDDGEVGWTRPTVVIPTNERSMDWKDMIRFEGHRPRDAAKEMGRSPNLCVAPGFACGLTPMLGAQLEAVKDQCSVSDGAWRFFDFTRTPACPNYGFYLALYQRPCDTTACSARADNYGLLELAEPTADLDFEGFRRAVRTNNPAQFSSTSVQTYRTVAGHQIAFEVAPAAGQSSLVELDGHRFDRDYRQWPRAQGDTMQSTTPGRYTIDSPRLKKRLILDVTTGAPRRLSVDLPVLRRSSSLGGDGGRFFDDGGAVTPNLGMQSIAVDFGSLVTGLSVTWRSGLGSAHGSRRQKAKLDLGADEFITEVGLGTDAPGQRVRRLRITTNKGRQLSAGSGAERMTYKAGPGEQIIAFYGHAGAAIDRLGVIVGSIREPASGADLAPTDEASDPR